MSIVSALTKPFLMLVIACMATAYAGDGVWPVEGGIDLSSGFCEFRPGHFHGGVDIRTGSKEGRKVFSPVDGYIWRLKYSYIGYGKGVYMKDAGGYIYVLGHLSRLSDRLKKTVRKYQYANQRYSFDLFFEPDSIPVKQGELIGFSGQSGYGPPHIHFEKRDPDNRPLNLLAHGFGLSDNQAPEIEKAALIYFDDNSLFADGQRRTVYDVSYDKASGRYLIDTVILVQGQFGVAVRAFDRIRPRGPRLNLYGMKLYIDDYLYYENRFDRYDYAETQMVDLLFDFAQEVNGISHWHLLYNLPGKKFSGSKSQFRGGGLFSGETTYSYGIHTARVEISDAAGNQTELVFRFVLAPADHLFKAEWISDTLFYLHGNPNLQYLDIEQVQVLGKTGNGGWQKFASGLIETRGKSDFRVTIPSSNKEWKVLKVRLVGRSGWHVDDIFLPVNVEKKVKYSLKYSIKNDGIQFKISSRRKFVDPPRLEVLHEDGYVLDLPVKQLSQNKFAAFYKCENIASQIVRFDLYNEGSLLADETIDVDIVPVGVALEPVKYAVGNIFIVTAERDDFYQPSLMEVERQTKLYPKKKNMIGSVYSILPKTIPLAGKIEVAFNGDYSPDSRQVCIYRLNKKNKWKPLKTSRQDGRLVAETGLVGEFAILEDTDAPRVKNIKPGRGKTVGTAWPEIRFTLGDNISGIENDSDIAIFLDGIWLIPEYDPELEKVITSPRYRLADGRHELKIMVFDRAGNERIVYSEFFVKTKKEE